MKSWLIIIFMLIGCGKPAIAIVEPEVIISVSNDRCAMWVQTVRIEHTKYFGLQFPYWYGVGQLKAESACRADVGAFDGGQGIAQFMPKTARYIASLMGEALDPYNPRHAIRMQAFYMDRIHRLENWSGKLWIDYAIYNGGKSSLYAEYKRAGVLDWDLMKLYCQRRKIPLKSGILDLCHVNYLYTKKIEQYSDAYRRGADGMEYW